MSTNTKPIAEWTLGDVQRECTSRDEQCRGCPLTTDAGCRIGCDTPNLWTLTDKPNFTEDEVATMRVLYGAGARRIERHENHELEWKYEKGIEGNPCWLPCQMFPSLLPGQLVEIGAVIGQK